MSQADSAAGHSPERPGSPLSPEPINIRSVVMADSSKKHRIEPDDLRHKLSSQANRAAGPSSEGPGSPLSPELQSLRSVVIDVDKSREKRKRLNKDRRKKKKLAQVDRAAGPTPLKGPGPPLVTESAVVMAAITSSMDQIPLVISIPLKRINKREFWADSSTSVSDFWKKTSRVAIPLDKQAVSSKSDLSRENTSRKALSMEVSIPLDKQAAMSQKSDLSREKTIRERTSSPVEEIIPLDKQAVLSKPDLSREITSNQKNLDEEWIDPSIECGHLELDVVDTRSFNVEGVDVIVKVVDPADVASPIDEDALLANYSDSSPLSFETCDEDSILGLDKSVEGGMTQAHSWSSDDIVLDRLDGSSTFSMHRYPWPVDGDTPEASLSFMTDDEEEFSMARWPWTERL